MPYFKDLTGKKFNRLTVISQSKERLRGMIQWDCVCECGGEVKALSARLNGGYIKSCGCLALEMSKKRKNRLTHGLSKTRIYRIWAEIKKRCNSKSQRDNHSSYTDRGIKYCSKWERFEGFYEDMKDGYKDNLTIDRINNDKGYSKNNCKWSTPKEQANNRRSNKFYKYLGKKYTQAQLSEKFNVNYGTLVSRIRYGWSVSDAINIPRYGKWGEYKHYS